MLEVKGLSTFYGSIQALHGVSLTVNQGEIVTLIGGNGAGKTTTLNTICGLIPAADGQVLFEGKDITRLPPFEIARMGISQSPEGRKIFTQLTVRENLEMGAFARRDKQAIRRDMEAVYERFPRLQERRKQPGGTLSGGEQQMLAMGRALMAKPRLLLLDEPSMGLAPLLVREIFNAIEHLNKELGVTILLVEQNALMALAVAHRGYVLESGLIVHSGTSSELRHDPAVIEAYLGA
ncbi:MAG: ABC transporter ATP-binding protein [Anaerolineae bacterium]